MYLLGFDIGSSSIKAALVLAETGATLAIVQSPETEMSIAAPQPGWAEQDPEMWWEHVCLATQKLLAEQAVSPHDIKGIGIAYQMHGLVLIDQAQQVLRPSIIWCDSRAVEIGDQAFKAIGEETCLQRLLNSPGNFTASKLKWVKEHEPDLYRQVHKMMLPGDYVAMRMTGEVMTTSSGLSEGILWDYQKEAVADLVLDHYGIDPSLIPPIVSTCSQQGKLTTTAASTMGLSAGIPVAYRAGDQPNNALSLSVLQPGEVAATGGTSGVVYGVVDQPVYDPLSRVNGFVHVNHTAEQPRIGVLLCINGAGIQYSWIKQNLVQKGIGYKEMDELASGVPVGSDELHIFPFGNGAERMLGNQNPGAQVSNLQFNRHTHAHLYRAALEGIAFSFVHGMHILRDMGLSLEVMRVGNENLFQSQVFAETIASLLSCTIEVVETTGAVGAAKASGVATGVYPSLDIALKPDQVLKSYQAQPNSAPYESAFAHWERGLTHLI